MSTFLEIHTMGISDSGTRITLRLPEQLHNQLVARARQNQRSLNSEIVYALLDSTSTQYSLHKYHSHTSPAKTLFVAEGGAANKTKDALLNHCENMTTAQQAALLKFLSEQ